LLIIDVPLTVVARSINCWSGSIIEANSAGIALIGSRNGITRTCAHGCFRRALTDCCNATLTGSCRLGIDGPQARPPIVGYHSGNPPAARGRLKRVAHGVYRVLQVPATMTVAGRLGFVVDLTDCLA
jgi:hypothetical protein